MEGAAARVVGGGRRRCGGDAWPAPTAHVWLSARAACSMARQHWIGLDVPHGSAVEITSVVLLVAVVKFWEAVAFTVPAMVVKLLDLVVLKTPAQGSPPALTALSAAS